MDALAIDTETTGVDLRHGAKPFIVTMADYRTEEVSWWEWEVDPLTRTPVYPPEDIEEIQEIIRTAPKIVFQNAKFDVAALNRLPGFSLSWPWEKTEELLYMAHILSTEEPHNLETLALKYLRVDLARFENDIRESVKEARRIAKRDYPEWRIAETGLPEMPSARGELWKNDMWLPAALAREKNYPEDHPWRLQAVEYANGDSSATAALFPVMLERLRHAGKRPE